MNLMSLYVLAFLIGVIAGLRSLTAPAVLSWTASLGWLHLENTGACVSGLCAHSLPVDYSRFVIQF